MSSQSTAGRMLRSAGAATFSHVWRFAVTFATHMLLRRMVSPEDWGVWQWAEPLFLILAQIRDLGVPGHVVRSSPRPYANYLGLQIGWGGALALGVAAAAPLLAAAYSGDDPNVVPVLRFLALFLVIQGLGAVPMVYFEAELALGKVVVPELARNTCFAGLSLLLAYLDYGVWSMVLAHTAAAAVYTVLVWWRAVPTLDLTWIRGGTWPLARASLPLALMAALLFLSQNVDPFVLALRFPGAVVGTAGLALFAVFFIIRNLGLPVGRALYPAMVAYASDPPRAFEAYRIATLCLLTVAAPAAFFFSVNAELVVRILAGDGWSGAVAYLRVLAFAPLLHPFTAFGIDLLLTRHRDRLLILYCFTNLVTLGGLGWFFTRLSGPVGMAWANYLPLGSAFLLWGLWEADARGLRRLSLNLLEIYAAAGLAFGTAVLATGSGSPWPRAAASCLAALAVAAYAVWRHGADFRRFFTSEGA